MQSFSLCWQTSGYKGCSALSKASGLRGRGTGEAGPALLQYGANFYRLLWWEVCEDKGVFAEVARAHREKALALSMKQLLLVECTVVTGCAAGQERVCPWIG
jgi:hypothetical protein